MEKIHRVGIRFLVGSRDLRETLKWIEDSGGDNGVLAFTYINGEVTIYTKDSMDRMKKVSLFRVRDDKYIPQGAKLIYEYLDRGEQVIERKSVREEHSEVPSATCNNFDRFLIHLSSIFPTGDSEQKRAILDYDATNRKLYLELDSGIYLANSIGITQEDKFEKRVLISEARRIKSGSGYVRDVSKRHYINGQRVRCVEIDLNLVDFDISGLTAPVKE